MDAIKADLQRVLAKLDTLGQGGGAVAIHVADAIAAAEQRRPGDFTGFSELEAVLWPRSAPMSPWGN